MGLVVDGQWQEQSQKPTSKNGEFVRQATKFHHWIGEPGYEAESGRYHLFVSLACPWAHRTLIFRKLKKLEHVISITIVDAKALAQGWAFSEISKDNPIEGIEYLHQVYTAAKADYTGRVTVPILWDKKKRTIVNNESAEIIRMLNSAFDDFTDDRSDYYPEDKREEIEEINELVYENINNGVYRAGFATTQAAYEKAFHRLFDALNLVEERLGRHRYLVGPDITEADWRLFTTLIRFDAVYFSHFKANLRRVEDYPNLSNYLRDLYQVEGVSDTVDLDYIKMHYYYSHESINPTRIVPLGPELDFDRPHDRARFTDGG
jgi:putative glutathione S-transferase